MSQIDTARLTFSNKLMICGIGGIGAILLFKKLQKNKPQQNETQKQTFTPLISPMTQGYVFAITSITWFLQLKPNIMPTASQFVSNTLRSLYSSFPPSIFKLNISNINTNLFTTKKRSLITVAAFMTSLTAYRKSYICRSMINKILMNNVSLRIYECFGYIMPWIVMMKSAYSNTNSFNYFMAWFSSIFVSNALSVNVGDPLFSFVKIRSIPYFSLLSYSLGLLSPNIDIWSASCLVYVIASSLHSIAFVGYKLGFDNANIKAYSGLTNMVMILPNIYFNPQISLYIAIFFWIPNVYYLYYVMGIEEITEIENGVYLGNMPSVNQDNIDKYNIANIVELHDEYRNSERFKDVNYLSIEIGDRSFIPINEKFNETNAFIAKCVENEENVLIHCSAGVSRSATIATAYLIDSGYCFDDAMDRMKRLRSTFDPNTGYVAQLKAFAQK